MTYTPRIAFDAGMARVERLYALMDPCRLCPRACGARRRSGETGFCGAGPVLKLASWNAHHGEEPPISGTRGSGTLFTSHCTLGCLFCQNFPFSQLHNGEEVCSERLVKVLTLLARRGVHNFNLVTPVHFIPQLLEGILRVRETGAVPPIPIVYNTSGYESLEVLELLDGLVDIWLPDIKYADDAVALRLSRCADYVTHDRQALKAMFRMTDDGKLVLDENGIATSGMIIRHLVLPERLSGTRASFEWLKSELGTKVHISLMCQYFPAHQAHGKPPLDREITHDEYLEAIETVETLGFENVLAQDPEDHGGA
ncbi:MAG TPA: radical SAM protein [Candidatus Ozemobacteraceae bacterium]